MDPSVYAVFSNHLVWRNLGKYLNYSDLKACRIVCREFNRNILEETNFKSRTWVTLREKHICPQGFGTTTEKWTNIKILPFHVGTDGNEDKSGNDCKKIAVAADFSWLYPLLSNVETLEIGGRDVYSDELVCPPVQNLIEAPNMLKKLSLDMHFLCERNDVFKVPSEAVRKTLSGLSEFVVQAFVRGPLNVSSDDVFFDAIGMIGTSTNHLKLVKVDNIIEEDLSTLSGPGAVDEDMHWKLQNLLRIVEVNKHNITSLQLHNIQLWSTWENADLLSMTKLRFPFLTVVKIRTSQTESPNVVEFLRLHPLLEELDLTVLNSFPNALLAVIGERSINLKILRIATKVLEGPHPTMWTFLNKLENLREFQLNLIKSYAISSLEDCVPSTIFSCLPPSTKKISLRGLSNPRNRIPTLLASDFVNVHPSAITVLNLSKCFDINDEAVEFICRNFKSLITLNLSDSLSCTDYGFTGLPLRDAQSHGHSPFSIADIKGLKSLTLRACGSITDLTLTEGIKFLELRFLDVCNNIRITEAGCLTVLKHNPSLEILQTAEFDEFPTEDEMKITCPRLKQHTYPHDDYSDDDDASINDDSDFSGGGYRMDRMDDFYDAVGSEDFDDNDFDDEDEDDNDWY